MESTKIRNSVAIWKSIHSTEDTRFCLDTEMISIAASRQNIWSFLTIPRPSIIVWIEIFSISTTNISLWLTHYTETFWSFVKMKTAKSSKGRHQSLKEKKRFRWIICSRLLPVAFCWVQETAEGSQASWDLLLKPSVMDNVGMGREVAYGKCECTMGLLKERLSGVCCSLSSTSVSEPRLSLWISEDI